MQPESTHALGAFTGRGRSGFVVAKGSSQEQPEALEYKLNIQLTVEDTTAVMAILDRMADWATSETLPADMIEFVAEKRNVFASAVEEAVNGWGFGSLEEVRDEEEGERSEIECGSGDDAGVGKKVN